MKDLKAIFFARDFVGNSEYGESQELGPQSQSRKAEVPFRDGEKLVGTTDTYNPQRVGFFLVPADPRSNDLRVFVIAKKRGANSLHLIFVPERGLRVLFLAPNRYKSERPMIQVFTLEKNRVSAQLQ